MENSSSNPSWFRRHPIITVILVLFVIGSIMNLFEELSVSENNDNKNELCDRGNKDACWDLCAAFGREKDYNKAFPFCDKGCNLEHAQCCFVTGAYFDETDDRISSPVQKDNRKAYDYYYKSCNLGFGEVCNAAYETYRNQMIKEGRLIPEDNLDRPLSKDRFLSEQDKLELELKLHELHGKGCNLGVGFSCYVRGIATVDKQNDVRNIRTAMEYFRQGCTLGEQRSCEAYKLWKNKGY